VIMWVLPFYSDWGITFYLAIVSDGAGRRRAVSEQYGSIDGKLVAVGALDTMPISMF
jgi:hypothetical protein